MEPLKAGDWVTVSGPAGKFLEQISSVNTDTYTLRGTAICYKSQATKWLPEIGSYQWFAKDAKSEPIFAKLVGINYMDASHTDINWFIIDRYQSQWNGMGTTDTNIFKHCTPFIGELPQYYKE